VQRLCKLFNLLLLNLIQLFCNWHDNGISEAHNSIFGGQKYLDMHHLPVRIARTVILNKKFLNISDTNMAAEKLEVIRKFIYI
jgi:hypothetical protein